MCRLGAVGFRDGPSGSDLAHVVFVCNLCQSCQPFLYQREEPHV